MGDTSMLRPEGNPYDVALAADAEAVREAQRLRWRVFAGELRARIDAPEPGIDADRWDPYCEHLLVREARSGRVIGTYRLLTAERAQAAGGFYAETEFALHGLHDLGPGLVEVGRACVDREHRNGVAVALLWAGVLRYLQQGGHAHVIGCASVPAADEPARAAALCRRLLEEHGASPALRATPRRPFPLAEPEAGIREAGLPPLLKGYLRLGARICGAPAWDPDFGTADLLVHLPLERLSPRHATRLLRAA